MGLTSLLKTIDVQLFKYRKTTELYILKERPFKFVSYVSNKLLYFFKGQRLNRKYASQHINESRLNFIGNQRNTMKISMRYQTIGNHLLFYRGRNI